jgi:hypothetical protein
MVTPDGPEPTDPGERFDIDTEQFAAAAGQTDEAAEEAAPAEVSPKANDEIAPVMDATALPLLETATLREDALDDLLAFYVYGARPEDLSGTDTPTPALLHGYGDLSRVRHDYPLCLTRQTGGSSVVPLRAVVDGVIEKVGATGDDAERLRRHLFRLESQMRTLLDDSESVALDQLWGAATERVLEGTDDDSLRNNLTAAREALTQEADVLGFGAGTPRELFVAIATREWRKRSGEFGAELEQVLRGLEDILRVDESHTPEASSPDHLRSASGKGDDDEVDFLAMSSLLGSSHLGDPLPAERRERIRSAVNMMRLASPLFEAQDLEDNPTIGVTRISTDTAAAHAGYESRMQLMANFFRAVRIARIEIANGYRPDVHDPFFENFDAGCAGRYLQGTGPLRRPAARRRGRGRPRAHDGAAGAAGQHDHCPGSRARGPVQRIPGGLAHRRNGGWLPVRRPLGGGLVYRRRAHITAPFSLRLGGGGVEGVRLLRVSPRTGRYLGEADGHAHEQRARNALADGEIRVAHRGGRGERRRAALHHRRFPDV